MTLLVPAVVRLSKSLFALSANLVFNCPPVTASVEPAAIVPSANPVNFTLFTEIFASVVVPPAVFLGLKVILATSAPPEEMVNPSLPVIPFISVKVSANFTTKPFAFFVASFSTRMFTPAAIEVAVVSTFVPPLTVNVVSNFRSTPWLSSPVKVIALPTVVFKVVISPVFVAIFVLLVSIFCVFVEIFCVFVATSCFTACN